MSPLERLRLYFEKNPELRPLSTQAGLARLIGRSESLVRSVEKGRVKMSSKLARTISEQLGVDDAWLMQVHVDSSEGPIPALGGGQLDYVGVLSRITTGIESGLEKVKPPPISLEPTKRRMLEAILSMVEVEILDYWQNAKDNPTDPVPELLGWLRQRAEKRTIVR